MAEALKAEQAPVEGADHKPQVTPVKVEAPKEAPSVVNSRMQLSESVALDYFVTAESRVTRQDINRPEFWAHVARQLRPFSRLRVTTDDAKFIAELVVITAGSNWAVVREIFFIDLENALTAVPDLQYRENQFYIQYKGTKLKWSIIRKSDSAIIKSEIPSKDMAELALAEYVKVITK